MPGMGGFDVIRQLPAGALPVIVIVTAYDQHAIAAFEAGAVDYLLKPSPGPPGKDPGARARPARPDSRNRRFAGASQRRRRQGPQGRRQSGRRIPPDRSRRRAGFRPTARLFGSSRRRNATWPPTRARNRPAVVWNGVQRVHRNALVNVNHVRKMTPLTSQRWLLTLSGGLNSSPASASRATCGRCSNGKPAPHQSARPCCGAIVFAIFCVCCSAARDGPADTAGISPVWPQSFAALESGIADRAGAPELPAGVIGIVIPPAFRSSACCPRCCCTFRSKIASRRWWWRLPAQRRRHRHALLGNPRNGPALHQAAILLITVGFLASAVIAAARLALRGSGRARIVPLCAWRSSRCRFCISGPATPARHGRAS